MRRADAKGQRGRQLHLGAELLFRREVDKGRAIFGLNDLSKDHQTESSAAFGAVAQRWTQTRRFDRKAWLAKLAKGVSAFEVKAENVRTLLHRRAKSWPLDDSTQRRHLLRRFAIDVCMFGSEQQKDPAAGTVDFCHGSLAEAAECEQQCGDLSQGKSHAQYG